MVDRALPAQERRKRQEAPVETRAEEEEEVAEETRSVPLAG